MVNRTLYIGGILGFCVLPPILLVVRFLRPRTLPWWSIVCLTALLAWCFINASTHFYFAHLDDLIRSHHGSPPTELLDRRANDGGSLTFAWLFGWLFGLVYLALCTTVYAAILLARRLHAHANHLTNR